MARIKLTQKKVAALPAPAPSGKQKLYWDSELVGFGVLCSGVTATRTFIVQRDVAGRTRRVTIERVDLIGLDEARERARLALADIYQGHDPKAHRANATLRETLEDYLKANTQLRDKSRRGYRASVENYLAAWLDRPLREITADMVAQRHLDIQTGIEQEAIAAKEQRVEAARRALKRFHGDALAQARANLDQMEAAPVRYSGKATADGVMRTLRALWNFAADLAGTDKQARPLLPPWPKQRLKRQWYKVPARTRHVRADDLPAFYKAVLALANPIQRDYVLLLLFTGLRRSEAAGLRWEDVDFVERVIRLPAARMKGGKKALDLPMTDVVRDLLVARRAVGKETFVFPSDSKSKHISEPKSPLAQVREACGVRVSAHDLRRTYITAAESADIAPLALKALVNHSLDKNDVTSSYIQMTAERLREPTQRVADKLKALCGIAPAAPANVEKLK